MGKVSIKKKQVEACRRIHIRLNGACVIKVKYGEDGVEGMGVYPDGVKEFVFEPYRSACPEYGQHFKAMEYIQNYV